jgi:hypothetical protein
MRSDFYSFRYGLLEQELKLPVQLKRTEKQFIFHYLDMALNIFNM